MASDDVEQVTKQLSSANLENVCADEELSFAGRGLKLDTEADAAEVANAIRDKPRLTVLKLEGNTFGVDAAKSIAKALSYHPEFQRALWKDIFTGRLKSEIPTALMFLSGGLTIAKARLVELDLSDNAFGPIGVEGIAGLLKSETCFTLQELKLNNNGLGIGGGRLLAKSLEECHHNSSASGTPLKLKVFICGRNRLENEGAIAIATFFKIVGTLEEVQMPQNGIFHQGITTLADALQHNPNLTHINFNDNIFTEVGAKAIAEVLPKLQNLQVINFGDCLLRSEGAKAFAKALRHSHTKLKEVYLGYNEINYEAAVQVVESMEGKTHLQSIELNGNKIGEDGCELIKGMMETFGKPDVIESLSDDDGDEDDEEDEEEDEDEEYEEEVDENETTEKESEEVHHTITPIQCSPADYMLAPTAEKLLGLGNDRAVLLLEEIEKEPDEKIERSVDAFVRLSTLVKPECKEVTQAATKCVDVILQKVFSFVEKENSEFLLSNTFLVHLGLIKSEDKQFRPPQDLSGCLFMLEHAVRQSYFLKSTKDVIKLFLSSRLNKAVEQTGQIKHQLMQTLYKY